MRESKLMRPSFLLVSNYVLMGSYYEGYASYILAWYVENTIGFNSHFFPQAEPNPALGSPQNGLNPASLPFIPGTATTSLAAAAAAAASTSPSSSASVCGSTDRAHPEFDNDLKNPISLVHEGAHKRELEVSFTVVREIGPPHMRTFFITCTIGDVVTEGRGSSKKVRDSLFKTTVI